MGLRDLLRKKDKIERDEEPAATIDVSATDLPDVREFRFVRTDTNTETTITLPEFEGNSKHDSSISTSAGDKKKRFSAFRRSRSPEDSTKGSQREHRTLSEKLHLHNSQSSTSVNIPANLPEIADAYSDHGDREQREARWEERATRLASTSPGHSPGRSPALNPQVSEGNVIRRPQSASDAASDVNIQDAIRLHEEGNLEQATQMFRVLADRGNVLSQVLYGLSLRHGWGCQVDMTAAVGYLSKAASNSAAIEQQALQAGLTKGGAAKGELVLAIFELGNCFRYGWGVAVDKVAARQYYETAANLGDVDAMNEAAWCYLEGFGGKKDKFRAAQLLRLAEKNSSKTLGNSWIWKEKYNPQ